MKPKLLIVDDDEEIRTQMRWALAVDYDVTLAGDRKGANDMFALKSPSMVLLDLGLPPDPAKPGEGLETLNDLLVADPTVKVIIISGQGEKETALRAVGAGAYDFHCKPVDIDELKIVLKRCAHVSALEREYHEIKQQLQGDGFGGLLGMSAAMQPVFDTIRKVSTSDAPVLILGESGTGKEMVARAIHNRSNRRNKPFVAINCGAIPETLLESELFGHEKGAFTGAHVLRKGRVELAHGGILFLDEIGEMPTATQVKLLRFLQEKRIERIGGREEIAVDVRVLAATNVDLPKAMTSGSFREDLFYRLAVVQTTLPPMRDRDNDILLLARSFLDAYAAEARKSGLLFGHLATKALLNHPWPGNVRELQNRVRRAVVMCDGKRITPEDLDLSSNQVEHQAITLKEAREEAERNLLQQALRRNAGSITHAAAELGISRPTIYDLMNKLGIGREGTTES